MATGKRRFIGDAPAPDGRNWVKAAGWRMIEIKAGHDAMVIAPDRLGDLLDADAA